MINIKPLVLSSLTNDAVLISQLNGPHIYRQYPVDDADLKSVSLIVYSEPTNKPLIRADERELVSIISMQLDIWSLKSTSEIAISVDRIMTELGAVRENASDDDEDHPRQCKPMVYNFTVDEDGMIY